MTRHNKLNCLLNHSEIHFYKYYITCDILDQYEKRFKYNIIINID